MMAGMAGVPPGAFIPHYMQPMPYPPNMPPPNGQREYNVNFGRLLIYVYPSAMYAPPPMGQMPREFFLPFVYV